MIFNEQNFFIPLVNSRFYQDETGLTCYINNRKALNYFGINLIADYYNKKYFTGTDKKIITTTSLANLKEKISTIIETGVYQSAGFMFPANDDYINCHYSPLILEVIDGKYHLYIGDGAMYSATIATQLKDFCHEHQITLYINAYIRQADNGSCKSEALVYLKNALQQQNIKDNVRTMTADESLEYFDQHEPDVMLMKDTLIEHHFNVFLESPDMLKTTQVSSAIIKNAIDTNTILKSVKSPRSFQEKMAPHTRPVAYVKGGLAEASHPDTKIFTERDYLHAKTLSHFSKVQQIVEAASSQDDIDASISRSHSL